MSNEREAPMQTTASWTEVAKTRIEDAAHRGEPEKACTTDKDDPCARSKAVLITAFQSMEQYAMIELGRLKADLSRADKPTWSDTILEGLLDASLAVGGERAGEYLAEKLLAHDAKAVAAVLKKSFEEGTPAGIGMARSALGDHNSPDPEEFIAAQQFGVVAMYQDAQTKFIESGQDAIATAEQAHSLKSALDSGHLAVAAHYHYAASRDAYLSCLARQTLGETKDGTTDLSPGAHENGHAPSPSLTALGIDRGVLEVDVMLDGDVKKEPHVYRALLNGVNETIRKQYEHVPLSSVKIPRQIVCSVHGDMADFTVNVDEQGAMHLASGSGEWLQARARADGDPAGADAEPRQLERKGLSLLLQDLAIDELGRGGMR